LQETVRKFLQGTNVANQRLQFWSGLKSTIPAIPSQLKSCLWLSWLRRLNLGPRRWPLFSPSSQYWWGQERGGVRRTFLSIILLYSREHYSSGPSLVLYSMHCKLVFLRRLNCGPLPFHDLSFSNIPSMLATQREEMPKERKEDSHYGCVSLEWSQLQRMFSSVLVIVQVFISSQNSLPVPTLWLSL
jgi:hypothetical protein